VAHPLLLIPGDIGILIHEDHTIDLLLPDGDEKKPLTETHHALIGAAIGVMGDEAFAAYARRTGQLYVHADDGPAGEGH